MAKNKFLITVPVITLCMIMLSACGSNADNSDNGNNADSSYFYTPDTDVVSKTDSETFTLIKGTYNVEYGADDLNDEWDDSAEGIVLEDKVIEISKAGTYVLSGTSKNGQIVVNAGRNDVVQLVLNGVDISCKNSAPIYIKQAKLTIITLAEKTVNNITDGSSYVYDDTENEEPNSAVFSKDDLSINGKGTLNVKGNFNNGITGKDGLKIIGGTINVTAVNNGIKGKDYVVVKDGTINVTAGGNGIKASNDTDSNKGFIYIEGGNITVISDEDGIDAATGVAISAGNISVKSGGGNTNSTKFHQENGPGGFGGNRGNQVNSNNSSGTETVSTKGIKGGVDVTVAGGTITVDAADDAIHSNGSVIIGGGNIELASGDDGIHSDVSLAINGGYINITKSYEGLESVSITVNDGTIYIISDDDGTNASAGSGAETPELNINGGYIFVNASGDGLDSNGNTNITGGTIIVNGPTNSGNGALDADGTIIMTGGFLIAAGSSGMAEYPSVSSTQYVMNLNQTVSAGTLIHVEDANGNYIFTFAPLKNIQSLVFCSPALKNGETYVVYTYGGYSVAAQDGLYVNGKYSGGSKLTEFKISSIVTNVSSSGYSQGSDNQGMGGGMRPGGGGGRW